VSLSFSISATDGLARRGKLITAHGEINTPAFMPVGTAGTVKALTNSMIEETGAEIILGNTYHLMLRPGIERMRAVGGLHKFMNWGKPILTDSGGFQVMSLSKLRKITEEGVKFRSYIDGTAYNLTPEYAVELQNVIGSNITMVLDECTPYPAVEEVAAKSMRLSMRWAARCKSAFEPRDGYGIFGIVQGSVYEPLRRESALQLQDIGFDGYAIGGLAVGEGQEAMFEVLDFTMPHMPVDKPRYLMGVGKPADIIGAVARGVDMFDCVIPTRSGRNARAYTSAGEVNVRNAKYAENMQPVDAECTCYTCRNHSAAYLHHLFKVGEMLGPILLSLHNTFYYQALMQKIRIAIDNGCFSEFASQQYP